MAQALNCITHYQQVEIKTADQFELILLLYKGAVNQLVRAKTYFASGEIERRVQCVNKASAIIGELQASLDFEKGQQIAVSLDRLYSYMLRRLSEANLNQDSPAIDEIMKLLRTLQSAWEEAQEKSRE